MYMSQVISNNMQQQNNKQMDFNTNLGRSQSFGGNNNFCMGGQNKTNIFRRDGWFIPKIVDYRHNNYYNCYDCLSTKHDKILCKGKSQFICSHQYR